MDVTHHWAYDLLKRLACQTCSAQDLEELKQTFSAEIGSVRKAERIQTIHDLIEVLERHDELSEYNIDPLREVSEICGGNAIQHAVSAYYTPKETTTAEPINSYQDDRLAEEMRQKLHVSPNQRTMTPTAPPPSAVSLGQNPGVLYVGGPTIQYPDIHNQQQAMPLREALVMPADFNQPIAQQQRAKISGSCELTEDKRSDIYKNLSTKLGTDWRSFGRELRITEGEMDQIEEQFPRDIRSRIYRVLHLFDEDGRNNPKQFIFILCRALDNCRRKDLRRDIEDILSH